MKKELSSVEVFVDKDAVAQAAADRILTMAEVAIQNRGRFAIALAGGSTPELLYKLLAQPKYQTATDWDSWQVFFGDERLVPLDHEFSNYRMAANSLLKQVFIPAEQIYSVETSLMGEVAASAYEQKLRQVFRISEKEVPSFDLILAGLGEDGHTLSLFPGKTALNEQHRLVAFTEPGVLPPAVDRITLTLPVLAAAREVMFLATGEGKAKILPKVLAGPNADLPASLVTASEICRVNYLVDQAAAHYLNGN